MKLLLTVSLFCLVKALSAYEIISVSNGAPWGHWGGLETCPPGAKAIGYALKAEVPQGRGDDTALNAVALQCSSPQRGTLYPISSAEGPWGAWGGRVTCLNGYITAYALRVEQPIGSGDDTATNNIKFLCSDGEILEGYGLKWGTWGPWSKECASGICGIETKLESPQGSGDDTALNDVRLLCC